MDELITIAFLVKLTKATIAVVMMVMFSQWLDARAAKALGRAEDNPLGFGAMLKIMRNDPLAIGIYSAGRWIGMGILFSGVMGCAAASAQPGMTNRYDRQIEAAVETYWPDYPIASAWKAQLYQESRLRPDAVSPVGARGLAQFMPGTWRDMIRTLRLPPDLQPDHEMAIQVGAYYMARLRREWSAPRPALDRHQLAQASYNAGVGHLVAAQRACGRAALYRDIIACLPQITGRHSAETIGYVDRIAKWQVLIEAGL